LFIIFLLILMALLRACLECHWSRWLFAEDLCFFLGRFGRDKISGNVTFRPARVSAPPNSQAEAALQYESDSFRVYW
jgi:hypothetical protein